MTNTVERLEEKETPKPRFTGLFLPAEILELKKTLKLSYFELLLLSWVDAYYNEKYGGCFASNKHLSEKMGTEENTIAKGLTRLRKLKLIEDISFDGRRRVIRALIGKTVDKTQSIQVGVGQPSNPTLDNRPSDVPPLPYSYSKVDINTSSVDNKKSSTKKEKEISNEAKELAQLLKDRIKIHYPGLKEPNLDSWSKDMDKLLRVDKRPASDVRWVILWACSDSFWQTNILSAKKLRIKFDELFLKSQNNAGKKIPPKEKIYEENIPEQNMSERRQMQSIYALQIIAEGIQKEEEYYKNMYKECPLEEKIEIDKLLKSLIK